MKIRSKISKDQDQENSQNSIFKVIFANSIDHSSDIHSVLPRVSTLSAAAVFLIAVLGLAGNQLPTLKLLGSISEDYIPMAPSTAVSFIILSGIFLRMLHHSLSKRICKVFIILAVLVSLFGALEVAGTIIGVDLNFEDSIVPEAGYLGEMAIARMSLSTGALFFLAGLAVTALLLQRQIHLKGRFLEYFAGGFGAVVLITSFIFCGSYLYGSPLLYGQGSTIPMALTTASAFILLGIVTLIEAQKHNSRVASPEVPKDYTGKINNSQIRFILLFTIMVVVTLISISTMTLMLYRYDINQQKSQLIATAKGQARLIESIGRFNYSISELVHQADPDYDPLTAVVNQVAEAHENYEQSGQSMEITLARREGDLIEFLVRHRHTDSELPEPLHFDSELAVCQRLALLGQSEQLSDWITMVNRCWQHTNR